MTIKLVNWIRVGRKVIWLPPVRDTEREIGPAAEKIYDALKDKGIMSIPDLRQETRLWTYPFYEAMGHLAMQKKIALKGDKPEPDYAALP